MSGHVRYAERPFSTRLTGELLRDVLRAERPERSEWSE